MNRIFKFILVLAFAFSFIPVSAENDVFYLYVSADGNDENEGTAEKPLKTIGKAKETIKNISVNNIIVYISGGTYNVSSTIQFTQEDSGKNIKFVGYGETPMVLSGADEIFVDDFQNVTDENILGLLPAEAASRVKCVSLENYDDLGEMPVIGSETNVAIEPFADGRPMNISQYPNKSDKCLEVGDVKYTSPTEPLAFTYDDENLESFSDIENIWAYGGFEYYWLCKSVKLAEIDTQNKCLRFSGSIGAIAKKGQEYILYNVVEALDSEGEYYIDRTNKKLYFYPYEGMQTMQISKLNSPLIKIDSCADLSFENINFAYSARNAISIENSSEIKVNNCKFYNLGNNAIEINGGKNITISGSDFTGTGVGGIAIDSGTRNTLTHGNVVVDNCDIYEAARRTNSGSYCVRLYGCGNIVKNSRLYNMPHFAIAARGNEHTISNNEIYNVCNMSHDCGAIYFYGDWSYCGNVIKNNYFHHIYGRHGKRGIRGARCIYFDEMISGNEVSENIFAYAEEGVFVHGGRNVRIVGNLFFDCTRTATVEAISGIESFDETTAQSLISKLTSIPIMKGMWYEKYPFLSQIYNEYKAGDATYKYAKDNLIENNTLYNSSGTFMNKTYALPYSEMRGNIQHEAVLYR